jgi:hypothetical protein
MTIAVAFGCTGGGIFMMPSFEMCVTVTATLLSGILSGLVSAQAADALVNTQRAIPPTELVGSLCLVD